MLPASPFLVQVEISHVRPMPWLQLFPVSQGYSRHPLHLSCPSLWMLLCTELWLSFLVIRQPIGNRFSLIQWPRMRIEVQNTVYGGHQVFTSFFYSGASPIICNCFQEFYDEWPIKLGEVEPYKGPKTPDGRVSRHVSSVQITICGMLIRFKILVLLFSHVFRKLTSIRLSIIFYTEKNKSK